VKILEKLRTASLNSEFTGFYKKSVMQYFLHCMLHKLLIVKLFNLLIYRGQGQNFNKLVKHFLKMRSGKIIIVFFLSILVRENL